MPLHFTFRQLEYFVAVGEAGSIALAAEKVNVSSPSISTAITHLEEEFGLQLFVRKHAQGLALTQAGRQFITQAVEVLKQAESLNRLAADVSGKVQGPISVGCLLTFAQLIVPRLRRKFESLYPEVRVLQFELNQQDIFDDLRSGRIDIALTYDLEIAPDLQFIPLQQLPPYVLLAETHPLADEPTLTTGQLNQHPMVLLDLPFSNEYFLSLFSKEHLNPLIAERTRDMAVMHALVANGFGYSIANAHPQNNLSPDGKKLRFIPLIGDVRPMTMGLALIPGAENVLTVRRFIEHCQEWVTKEAMLGSTARDRGRGGAP